MSQEAVAYKRLWIAARVVRGMITGGFFVGAMLVLGGGQSAQVGKVLMAIAAVSAGVLMARSVKVAREGMNAGEMLARGDLADAEKVLMDVVGRFSLFPARRAVDLYHLALVRQKQGRLAEAAELAGVVLVQGGRQGAGGDIKDLQVGSAMVRAEAFVGLGEFQGAYWALQKLWEKERVGRIGLSDQVRLLAVRSRYEAGVGAWEGMLEGLYGKLGLMELMSPRAYAVTNALMAAAARKKGDERLGRWFAVRAVSVGWGGGGENAEELVKLAPSVADWMKEEAEGL